MATRGQDTLKQILLNLKSKSEDVRARTARELRQYVELESRETGGEGFSRFMNDLQKRISEMVNNPDPAEKFAGIIAIDVLIDVDCEENAIKITRFANSLRIALQSTDIQLIALVARALGRLVRVGGTLVSDVVEFEAKRAIEWLQGESKKDDSRRHAAVLVLKELATNAPTVFYGYVKLFLGNMWGALRDPNVIIREGASDALAAVLALIAERESRFRVEWYYSIYEECNKGLTHKHPEVIHGSLLAIGELLRNTKDFMSTHFVEVCERVLKFRDNKDKLVRRAVILLIPRLAAFSPEAFVSKEHLSLSVTWILNQIKAGGELKPACFIALGELALAVSYFIRPYLDPIIFAIKDALPNPKTRKPQVIEAVTCIAMLCQVEGQSVLPHMPGIGSGLLDLMFGTGLSPTLTKALSEIAKSLPTLLPHIQERLLDIVSIILARSPYKPPGTPAGLRALPMSPGTSASALAVDLSDHSLVILALTTLSSFDMEGHSLTDFVRDCVVLYLDDDNSTIRKEAALASCKLLANERSADGSSAVIPIRGHAAVVVCEVLEKLLTVGISDPDYTIRQAVLSSLDTRFDPFLALAENLRSLFIALNDEVFAIREAAITVIGRLSNRNPAYVLPSLRKSLLQLLTELEYSGDALNKEESARMLGHLIAAAPRLVKPYVPAIMKVLMTKIKDPSPTVAACVLFTLGRLAEVGGVEMNTYLEELFPLVIESLQDQSSGQKREVAVRTLGQLVESTGCVITPYVKYPQLLGIFLTALKSEEAWTTRREVVKVLGVIGALDPYKHKVVQQQSQAAQDKASREAQVAASTSTDIIPGMGPSSEDYYPTVAINALMRILRDPTLSTHHNMVIQAVMFIFKSLGLKCVPFLPQIMGPFLSLVKTCEAHLRDFLFQQLGILVSIVKQHIRAYLTEILALITEFWNSPLLLQIITLVEEICQALGEEFKPYLPELIPLLLSVLHTDKTERRSRTQKALHALEKFGRHLDDYLYLVIPSIVRVFESPDAPLQTRSLAVQTLGHMTKTLNFAEYASRLIHPLCRLLNGPISQLRSDAMDTLCALVYQLGSDYAIFIPMVNKVLAQTRIAHPRYDDLVSRILKNQSLPLDFVESRDDLTRAQPAEEAQPELLANKKLPVNQQRLRKAWEASQRSTKEDWTEWIRMLSVELIKESPAPALRSCSTLAQVYQPLARELFNAAFVSCWNELYDTNQEEVVRALEMAFGTLNLPPEVLQTLLNLAEFMEHDDKPLPIDIRALGALSENCQCYAKALHYKEIEFQENPSPTIEALISINNQLQQHEAAMGILVCAQQKHGVSLKESWYEKLQRWDDALDAYSAKFSDDPFNTEALLGRMRCLRALGEWEKLYELCQTSWGTTTAPIQMITAPPVGTVVSLLASATSATAGNVVMKTAKQALAPMAAAAAWNLGRWEDMATYVGEMPQDSAETAFFRSILAIHREQFDNAHTLIDRTRELMDPELGSLVGESYNRAYEVVVRVQQLSELEEIIRYKQTDGETRALIRKMWMERLKGCQRNVDYWQSILSVRKLVVSPNEDAEVWLKFASICRKANKHHLSNKTLCVLAGTDPSADPLGILVSSAGKKSAVDPRVAFAYMEHMYATNRRQEALEILDQFVGTVSGDSALLARCYLRLGEWQKDVMTTVDETQFPRILENLKAATEHDRDWYKAWHAWAMTNSEVVAHLEKKGQAPQELETNIRSAVTGFFRSIYLSPDNSSSLQDILRLLTLWFRHGGLREVEAELVQGFNTVSIDTWLSVIPQIIARINSPMSSVRRLVHDLLSKIGKEHPQALIYPLTVSSKSSSAPRRAAALSVLNTMRQHSPRLVEQALLVSQELIRVAILWHELWHEGLEEASRLYFGERNVEGMFATLAPLHNMMDKADTLREVSFQQAFGRDLQEALEWCKKYNRSRKEADLNQAWELYYNVFRRITKQLGQMTQLELQYVSPRLLEATDLELAVPGTYRAGEPILRISRFAPTLSVISSKQRPRKLTVFGSDGSENVFLLKGHEDLRQDERVMQLFGLVNTLLTNDRETSTRDLSISRMNVIPLSANAGLIEWLPNTDTLHALIRDYRDSRKILLNIEHRLMIQMAPDFDNLTLMQKVEVFEHALEQTTGQDLYKVLWLKSRNSEVWLDRRTSYTRSLAVMSMVGYILGLGDRHPSNIMLEKFTGKVVHIDFGDCFEVAMHREKYPEKIPFRLTRMLINAMEVSGIEGNFRCTCESVMRVLRENKDSVMAMLEAFVYDPLINWRLLGGTSPKQIPDAKAKPAAKVESAYIFEENDGSSPKHRPRSIRERELRNAAGNEGDGAAPETLNDRALAVINRISSKLTGRDFGNTEPSTAPLDYPQQVDRLIRQATSHENLCQCYIGWCPFW